MLQRRSPYPLGVTAAFLAVFVFGTLSIQVPIVLLIFSTIPLAHHIDRLLPGQLKNLKVQRLAAGRRHDRSVRSAIDLYEERTGSRTSGHAFRARRSLSSNAFFLSRLLNHWNFGGLLIFRTRGTVPVFVDGRAATAYPDPLLRDYFKLAEWEVDETAWDTVLEKYQIDAVLWVKGHEQLRRFLVDKRGWKEEYAGL